MAPLSGAIVGLVAVAVVLGGMILFGAPLFAIAIVVPLLLLGVACWFAVLVRARRRYALAHQHIRFEDEDKRTLVPSETPGDVHVVREE
jgi:predicted RND superfamily exporter protein